jgi:hypothetical protein
MGGGGEGERELAQIDAFREALIAELERQFSQHSWSEEDPLRGSACRSLSFDCRLDSRLRRAALSAAIDASALPAIFAGSKFSIMFINPGVVRVVNALTNEPRELVYSSSTRMVKSPMPGTSSRASPIDPSFASPAHRSPAQNSTSSGSNSPSVQSLSPLSQGLGSAALPISAADGHQEDSD